MQIFNRADALKIRNKREFVCPADGKWPDEEDCGK